MSDTALVLSLFPGIGLLDMAFEAEGFCVVRGPDVLWGGDVRRFSPPAGVFQGVIGGPPCQTFSTLANLVRASGHEPRFGNLIPEFERVVKEADPDWFLMENVRQAPTPQVSGFAVQDFALDNVWLGEEQRRWRKFAFGVRGPAAPNLMRWIEQAPLELPRTCNGVLQQAVNNSQEVKGRTEGAQNYGVVGGGRLHRGYQKGSVTAHEGGVQNATVTAAHAGARRPKGGRLVRYSVKVAAELQGLPGDFLDDAPFTAQGKLKAIANGVPLPMGRAVAKAVKAALAQPARVEMLP